MLLWVFVMFVLSLINVVISVTADSLDTGVMQIMALAILLNATGILYRMYFKARRGAIEGMGTRIRDLEERIARFEGHPIPLDRSTI